MKNKQKIENNILLYSSHLSPEESHWKKWKGQVGDFPKDRLSKVFGLAGMFCGAISLFASNHLPQAQLLFLSLQMLFLFSSALALIVNVVKTQKYKKQMCQKRVQADIARFVLSDCFKKTYMVKSKDQGDNVNIWIEQKEFLGPWTENGKRWEFDHRYDIWAAIQGKRWHSHPQYGWKISNLQSTIICRSKADYHMSLLKKQCQGLQEQENKKLLEALQRDSEVCQMQHQINALITDVDLAKSDL